VFDNRSVAGQPEYLAWLLSLPLIERERLLGNWKIRPAAGLLFQAGVMCRGRRGPANLDVVRYGDLTATEKTELSDPHWTDGVKLGRDRNGGCWPLDVVRGGQTVLRHRRGTHPDRISKALPTPAG
jgi:hypothetical protein